MPGSLWRRSLLPPGCEAAPNLSPHSFRQNQSTALAGASRPNGSKLPRHKNLIHQKPHSTVDHLWPR
ncbi:hypothetical protein DOZ80_00745 [Pseudomonas fluorescens]|uniref:Uncharacterized protein n=1 Tax=Pseudomonas fluorescens TaxID=294 RepID=A0A327NB57_PSEFL|nr:hypothetical protein DOZ80_00745 [Pseudomonas fluorescens]